MNLTVFDHFIALVKLDNTILSLSTEYNKVRQILLSVDQKICFINSKLSQSQEKISHLNKSITFHDLKLKTIDAQIRETELLLNVTNDPQKYIKAQKNLTTLQYEQKYWDDVLLDLWSDYELSEAEYSLLIANMDPELKKLKEDYQVIKNSLLSLEQQQLEYEMVRQDLAAKVPQDWLEKYTEMHSKVPNPVVIIQANSCAGCYCIVAPQDLLALEHRKLLRCRECFRFLYIERFNTL